jgi:hypothetical protein
MKQVLILTLLATLLFGVQKEETQKNIDEQMKKEKKYAQEQKFYTAEEYDFEGAEVDQETVDDIPEMPDYNDDFNMDSVYD